MHNLDNESRRKVAARAAIGRKCLELAWGRDFDEIHPEDRESALTDVVSDLLTAVVGPAGSWDPTEEGGRERLNYDAAADDAARNLLERSHTSWQGDAEDYTTGTDELEEAPGAELEPVIVVTRHPDYSDEISTHGVDPRVVYIDLGSSFDRRPADEEEAREWAAATWAEVSDLPADHPARAEVLEVIRYTTESELTSEQLAELLKLEEVV